MIINNIDFHLLINNRFFYIFCIICLLSFLLYISSYNEKIFLDLKKIDKMNGLDFENYIGKILIKKGYKNVSVTKGSGDFGVDVICYYKRKKYVFQVKRYSKNVGVGAIQEIIAGKEYYKADKAVAITNSYFTLSAQKMAKKCNVILIDRNNFINNNIAL